MISINVRGGFFPDLCKKTTMIMKTEELITDLIERTRQHINQVEKLKQQPAAELRRKPAPEQWSVLECIEHLNLYGDFYLPEIERRIQESTYGPEATVKSGWLGNYFANSMLPKQKLNKIKTFKSKNPNGRRLDSSVLDRFLDQQFKTLELLDRARGVSLSKTKTAITIGWLRLRLGDTFRVVIYHNQRHMVQVSNILRAMRSQMAIADKA